MPDIYITIGAYVYGLAGIFFGTALMLTALLTLFDRCSSAFKLGRALVSFCLHRRAFMRWLAEQQAKNRD